MNEHGNDHGEEYRPRWVPYTPPPPDGWERARLLLRRLVFPVAAVLFVVGVAGLFYWGGQMETAGEVRAPINVLPSRSGDVSGMGIEEDAGRAQVSVQSVPVGAAVRVNGDSIGTTPLTGRLLPAGVHMLSVRAPGYLRSDTVVVLRGGDEARLRFALRPRPGAKVARESGTVPSPQTFPQADRPLPVTSVPEPASRPPASPLPVLGALYVTSAPPGALVTVDGSEHGRTPLSVSELPVGPKQVALTLEGYEPWSTQVDVPGDAPRRVHAELRVRTGRLRILAQPWGTIYIDGALHARESDVWYETELLSGPHRITVVHPALGQQTQEVQVRAGEETSIVVDLQARRGDSP